MEEFHQVFSDSDVSKRAFKSSGDASILGLSVAEALEILMVEIALVSTTLALLLPVQMAANGLIYLE